MEEKLEKQSAKYVTLVEESETRMTARFEEHRKQTELNVKKLKDELREELKSMVEKGFIR